ncbi:FtsX-like permease family protein [bacterium]|nr:FtsX-like permease family protein [bacterium]
MIYFRLAYRNLVGAGLRTWLNVFVLSIAYVLIIWHQGIFAGMLHHGTRATITEYIGGGQFWQQDYDPLDPLSIDQSHGPIPAELKDLIERKKATAILVRQASVFPQGRLQNVSLNGIDPEQEILAIPSQALKGPDAEAVQLPILIGKRMAKRASLHVGDELTIRWRDTSGAFDALEATVVKIMQTDLPTIDLNQVWLPLERLQAMNQLADQATLVTLAQNVEPRQLHDSWSFRDQDYLLRDIQAVVDSKRMASFIMYAFLLFLAMLAVFDTQVLAIFKRRREIGTLMALGMTRWNVIGLFTLEGALNGLLALGLGAIYGIPLLVYSARHGFSLPINADDYGLAIAKTLYPIYSAGLIVITVAIVFSTVVLVSSWPTRQIAHLKPTDALRGKVS